MDEASTGPRSRHVSALGREAVVGVLILVSLAVVGFVTWVVAHDEPARAHVGAVFRGGELTEADAGPLDSSNPRPRDPVSSTYVVLPWGRVDVMVGAPRTSLPDDLQRDVGAVHPPDGGRFVGVSLRMHADSPPVPPLTVAPYPRTHLSLVVGGRTSRLETAGQAQDACDRADCLTALSDSTPTWVAVPGSARTIVLAAEYAGVTQTVDVHTGTRSPGVAAPLYTAAGQPERLCIAPHLPAGYTAGPSTSDSGTGGCVATTYRTPYLPRLGWAPAGREWIAVVPDITTPDSLDHPARGSSGVLRVADAAAVTVSVPGAVAVGPLEPADADLTSTALALTSVQVFSATPSFAGSLTVSTTALYAPVDDEGLRIGSAAPVALSWTGSL